MKDKILGSLVGVALGDALGMPTEFMTQEAIREVYGMVRELRAPHPQHYHSTHLVKGQITDDTEQTLALLDAFFRHGRLDAEVAAESLMEWAREKNVFGSTYLGPSSKKALQRLLDGEDPRQTGFFGTTIGGAMRMLPVALACLGDRERAVRTAAEVSMPTHGTSQAISGAAAFACALVESFEPDAHRDSILEAACWGAERGRAFGKPYPGPSLAKRIRWAVELSLAAPDLPGAGRELYDLVGVDMVPHEIVPVVLALFARPEEPMERLLAAVNIGGDTDTIASMLGALLGAHYGVEVFPKEMWKEIEAVNGIDLQEYAHRVWQCTADRRMQA
ncbi:MAG: ADP-ribosylglycohydrolase family protein [Limnochordia bacterium]|jgi:ADP-ribosylglycohydrolase|nr:ADP-ribosylglycohydrolase family protein [Bacillota bacterium]HOB40644.1 ADP-ribosylglycohydrolase family protein [Limnochordia bacterium]HOK31764.1 ADP-ribosylglycohydrolase family protein [Limnochordia bacterium]HOM00655.1 ADP-ribosylglycohydrolase family protein [Limnochordia bacterium]HPP72667.1 ADP-ribosylglycohydrolase family protein [Limnochordia bacterium]